MIMNIRLSIEKLCSASLLGAVLVFALGFGFGWFCGNNFSAQQQRSAPKTTWKPPPPIKTDEALAGSPKNIQAKKPPQTARAVIDRLLAELEGTDAFQIDSRIAGRLQQLRDFGEEGSKAVQKFLRTQQDIVLEGAALSNGRLTRYPSVRAALLDMLYDMNDPIAPAASLEVLRDTSSGLEVALAARNLEKFSPGARRSDALRAVSEILANAAASSKDQNPPHFSGLDSQVLEIIAYYQARELVPQVEELVKNRPDWLHLWMKSLLQFPAEDQADFLEKIRRDDKLRGALADEGAILGQFDLQNDKVRQHVRGIAVKNMTSQQLEQLVAWIGHPSYREQPGCFMKDGEADVARAAMNIEKGKIESSLRMLNELAPSLPPALRQRLEETRKQLREQLKNAR